jgi:hypothetical protein
LPGQPELVPELDEVVVPLEVEELVVPLEVLPELLPDEVLELEEPPEELEVPQRILLLCRYVVNNGFDCASAHHHRDADCSTKQSIFDGVCAG